MYAIRTHMCSSVAMECYQICQEICQFEVHRNEVIDFTQDFARYV